MRRTPTTRLVLEVLSHEPSRWRHGYAVMQETGLRSGTLYPILQRLSDAGLLEARWEASAPQGRPARHLYRLTASGRAWALADGARTRPTTTTLGVIA